jgi:hypothetical protein
MNKIHFKILVFIGIVAMLQACVDDFLELEPKTNLLEANAYKTEQDAFLAMTAVYDAQHVFNWNFVPIQSDIFSDDAFTAGEPGGGMGQWQDQETSLLDAENGASRDLWNRCYSGIYRANFYFLKEAEIAWEDNATKQRMHAEVLALRAYFYWDLVRHFGWVPIIESYISDPEAYKSIPQSTPGEVYGLIVRDLLAALPNLPEEVPNSELGRITQDMVQVLLARIYMFHEGFAKPVMGLTDDLTDGTTVVNKAYVSSAMDGIIGSGRYYLLPDYNDVFDWANENNDESIFEWQYSEKAISGDWGGWNVNGNFSVVFYGVRDPQGDPNIMNGWSFGTVSWSLLNEFEAGDPRLNATIYSANDSLTGYTRGFQNTGYFQYKYMPRAAFDPTTVGGIRDHNWPINYKDMRYAEVLLIAAELFMDSDNSKATGYLNEVRTRAMGPGAALTSIDLDDIYHERRVELAGEGHRKWDLLRRGLTYAKTQIDASWVIPPEAESPSDFEGRQFITDTWGMLPIPASEIRLVNEGMLVQHVPAFK